MPYSNGRIVHDADAHLMETPTWLRDFADPPIRRRLKPLSYPGGTELRQTGDPAEQRRALDASFGRLGGCGTGLAGGRDGRRSAHARAKPHAARTSSAQRFAESARRGAAGAGAPNDWPRPRDTVALPASAALFPPPPLAPRAPHVRARLRRVSCRA